jgi:two-component system NtrC family sensor kinase
MWHREDGLSSTPSMAHAALTAMNLGTKLTCYLLPGILVVMGLDLYLSVKRIQANLLHGLRREVGAISRTLQVALLISSEDMPEQYFAPFGASLDAFENVLGVVFYDREARVVAMPLTLQGQPLPEVNVPQVIATRTPVEGFFKAKQTQRYYRVEPIVNAAGEGIAAALILEELPLLSREFRDRAFSALWARLGLLALLASIVAIVIHGSVARPLRTLTRQVEAIGQGHFAHRLRPTRCDEIGLLAQEFDRMCTRLEAAYHQLAAKGEEKLRLERALHQSEQLAALGQLASRLAHEIGTPLNIIQGRAEQLVQRGALAEKDREFLGVIVTQIDRISGFIRQLLTLARRSEPHLRTVQLQDIVRRVADVVSDRGTATGVEVTLELAEDLPPVLGDAEQLQQVLLNLSVNALQAVGTAGRVTLRTRGQAPGPFRPAGRSEVEVVDTGPGIAPHDLPHIFEPFFTTKGQIGGTGLGLAISREIIRSHQGEIHVESTPGHGSRFRVSLPWADASLEPHAGGAGDQPVPLHA